ncbi:MAG: hypothetical protein LBQ88_17315 [Treponema sp.]|jgi:hypothetical protein|nr:hypothetical protein [Treponema sp.]
MDKKEKRTNMSVDYDTLPWPDKIFLYFFAAFHPRVIVKVLCAAVKMREEEDEIIKMLKT